MPQEQKHKYTALHCRVITSRTFKEFKVHWWTIPKLLKQIYFAPFLISCACRYLSPILFWMFTSQSVQPRRMERLWIYACIKQVCMLGIAKGGENWQPGQSTQRADVIVSAIFRGKGSKILGESFRRQSSLREHACMHVCVCTCSNSPLFL